MKFDVENQLCSLGIPCQQNAPEEFFNNGIHTDILLENCPCGKGH
jgi:hypothetical protein